MDFTTLESNMTDPYRLPPHCITDQTNFQRHYEARVDRPLADLEIAELFSGISWLQAGDRIVVCSYADKTFSRFTGERTARVVERKMVNNKLKITAAWVDEARLMPEPEPDPIVEVKPEPMTVEAARDESDKVEVKSRGRAGGFSVLKNGAVVETFPTKDQAEAYIKDMAAVT